MRLSGQLYQRVQEALMSAFGSQQSLEMAFFRATSKKLGEVSSSNKNLTDRTFELVGWLEGQGRTLEVIRGMQSQIPGNVKLKEALQELENLSFGTAPVTSSSPEVEMDNRNQRIARVHRDGLIPLISQAFAVSMTAADAFLDELTEEDTTYAKLEQLDRDTIADAARATIPGVKAVRINDAVQLLKIFGPDVRVSESGHLDIVFNILSQRWERTSSEMCLKDNSLFKSLEFPKPIIGWDDGLPYPPDAEVDALGNPLKSSGVRDYLMGVRQADLHPWIAEAARDYPHRGLVDLMRYLRKSGMCKSAIEVFNFLISPSTTLAANVVQVKKILKDAESYLNSAQAPQELTPSTTQISPITEQFIRETLAEIYPSTSGARTVASDIGLRTGDIDFSGPASAVWFSIWEEAKKRSAAKKLIVYVAMSHPNNPKIQKIMRSM